MIFTFWNIIYQFGIILFIAGALNLVGCVGQSAKKWIVCFSLIVVGAIGFCFGDGGRRKETFQFEIATETKDTIKGIRELPSGSIQVIFNSDRTKMPSGQLTVQFKDREFFENKIKEDADGTYIELTRDEFKRLVNS